MPARSPTLMELRALLRTFSDKAPPSRLQDWAPIAKVLVVLAAGIWTLAMYLSHERAFQGLLNEHQRLANEQLNFTIKQGETNAEYDLARAKLAAETAALQNELLRLQIRDQTSNGVFVTHDINVNLVNAREGLYVGVFEISIENTTKEAVEISWAAFELYIGRVTGRASGEAITYVNPPPNRELEQLEQHGPLTWKHKATYGYLYPNSSRLKYKLFEPYKYYKKGGPLMKLLSPGESTKFQMPLVISASRDRWVAVVTTLGMDGELSGDKVYNTADWVDLRSAVADIR